MGIYEDINKLCEESNNNEVSGRVKQYLGSEFCTILPEAEGFCPNCGLIFLDEPAISRRTGEEICPDCGQEEALEEMNTNSTRKDI